ncbi:periplasmic nitrate reductase, NapE protein [Pseudomonas sp. IT-P176]|uniref:periplasmic nitrate reductase, NapE protein n=1 Tax=Pseudomonas sp. IT-P176 TaxID=3026444 RepID=UPI0039E0E0D3
MTTVDESALRARKERRLLLFLIVFLFPLLSVVIVGGYGFFVWFLQMFLGPPGAPH